MVKQWTWTWFCLTTRCPTIDHPRINIRLTTLPGQMAARCNTTADIAIQLGVFYRGRTQRETIPASTTHWNNVGLMLGHRLRRWPNIKPTLFQCVVFAGMGGKRMRYNLLGPGRPNAPGSKRCHRPWGQGHDWRLSGYHVTHSPDTSGHPSSAKPKRSICILVK